MIISSLAEQYGIRVYSSEFKEMKWDEFKALVSGISPDTALGRIVSIRAEEDEEILKTFTKEQHKIRNDWLRKRAFEKTSEETAAYIEQMRQMFIQMAGGG